MVESIPEQQREAPEALIPLGRFGEPSEMASTAAFLASVGAAYVTGTVVPIDGGMSM
jgi:3-oxoacyl-[acyl-carrier protein] reductase